MGTSPRARKMTSPTDRRASGRVLGARPRALECSSYSTMSDRKVAVLPVGSAVVTSSRTRRGPADLPW